MVDEPTFEVKDTDGFNQVIPLVNEPYTYENMVNNPIIKPIAETDRSLRDLDDMIYKKLIDIKKLKVRINEALEDVPSYQDSSFVTDLIKLNQSADDVIKLQDIQFANTKKCIREVALAVKERYGVRLEDNGDFEEAVTVIPEGSVTAYLTSLCSHNDESVCKVATSILELMKTAKGKDDKDKLTNAGVEYYRKELDKSKRVTASRIIRMEI